jgi:ABC-2 type transport system permease protein
MTAIAAPVRRPAGWTVVAGTELRDLWAGGRALTLTTVYSLFLSVVVYLLASSTNLNFLEQRESVTLTAQLAIAVGALLAMILAADAISGERERSTLEATLLSPVSRRALVVGKLAAAFSIWVAAWLIVIPYIWFLGRGVDIVWEAIACTFVVGTLLAAGLMAFAMLVSIAVDSNRASLSVSLLVLLALLAPTQLPSSAQSGWAGESLYRLNPVTAGEHYVGKLLTNGHGWTQDLDWLVSPMIAAVALLLLTAVMASSLTLTGWRER